MGQSFSRRPASASTPATISVPDPEPPNGVSAPSRSLPRRILSSLPKPSLRSHSLTSSLTLPPRPEQTLRGKKRTWRLSRRHNVQANAEGTVPERMDTLPEHDEHHADRDVDEFGVITHRVPDSHTESPAASAKGKEKAKDVSDIDNSNGRDDESPIPSSSIVSPITTSGPGTHRLDGDEVVITPTVSPSPLREPPSSLPTQESERLFVPLPSTPTPLSPPQPSSQQASTIPRPFPPPGTLVVVQGVVHTTDVPRSLDRPATTSNSTSPAASDALNLNTSSSFDTSPTRPSSVPPGTRSRNPLSGILPRPSSVLPTVPFLPPSEYSTSSANIDSQRSQATSNINGAMEDGEDEDRAHTPQGISMTQGPVGPSGLSASSIDVLGTLLSVAAAATAASLLTGSSEPIFSSGFASNQPPPPFSQHPVFNAPSERPLSPTPTSDAGRMRHVWSSLRDRLGLGSGTHNTNPSGDSPSLSPSVPFQPSDVVRPRDPREIMLAEMARAFNLGLGLGAGSPSVAPSANSNTPELDGDGPSSDREGEPPVLPPPDSFERFLMDLQTDLRATLMQQQETIIPADAPRDTVDMEDDDPIPELQSISDSDSEMFETTHFDTDDEAEQGCEEDADEEDEEDVHTAQEQLSGRTSPAVSALGSGVHSPFGIRTRPGSPSSFTAGGMSLHHSARSQRLPTGVFSGADGEVAVDKDNWNEDVDAVYASPGIASGAGIHFPADSIRQSGSRSEEGPEGQREEAVLSMAHSLEASNGGRVEAEGTGNISGTVAVPPLELQDPSNVPRSRTGQESFLPGTASLSGPLASTIPTPLPGGSTSTTQVPSQPHTSSLPSSDPAQDLSSTNPTLPDSSMPFRLPFAPSSASRTEHTPGGGINWWRMYRFPAITSPNSGQGSQGSSSQSQTAFSTQAQEPNPTLTSSWARTTDQNQQNEVITPREVAQSPTAHSGLAISAQTPSAATSSHMPELVSTPGQGGVPPSVSTNGESSPPSTNANTTFPEHRSNVVVPVIVVGLQSVNMDRQPPPHVPHPHVIHPPAVDDEDGEPMDLDGLEQPMSMPLHIPEPPDFRHHFSPSNMTQQEQAGQQPARGRTWQSRAANAIRNLRPSRRNADTTSPPPQETPGSRTFLIYVIGGYYPPDHQIITGGNLDSFEALWELAELLGQVKPPTVSKEDIEKSGLEIIQASILEEYEKQGRVASNCTERCLICLDDYNPEEELRVLTCKHVFHRSCVDRWLETGRNNCPACRTRGVGNETAGPATVPSDPAIA